MQGLPFPLTMTSITTLLTSHVQGLPFPMPNKLDDITAEWMEALLKHRGLINPSCKVSFVHVLHRSRI
jgi:hypothetical protein